VRLIALAATVLVFARGGYGRGALFTTAGRLTHLSYSVWSPIVSGDRRRIEFGWSTKSGRPGGVGVMDADGTQLAYAGSSNRPNDLFVVRADGTHRRQLTHTGDVGEPGWLG
jgi:hypothetical protein